jgi:uncharacterized protein (TIGR00299 family) protein
MTVAALVDLGVPAAVVKDAVEAMGVRGLRVRFGRRQRGAYVGRSFDVSWPGKASGGDHAHEHEGDHDHRHEHEGGHDHAHAHAHEHEGGHDHPHEHEGGHDHPHAHGGDHHHPHDDDHERGRRRPSRKGNDRRRGRAVAAHADAHRDYAEVKRLLARARLAPEARELAGEIFARIAEVEGELHGTRVDRVTFHEVGAYDSIADVVGVAAAIAHLEPASIGSLPPVVGTGRVRTAHGPVPVPAPATAALLADIPILPEGKGELTTPTGAAILAATVDDFGPLPPLRVRAIGYGAGTRELDDRPNVLRAIVGAPLGAADAPAPPEVVLLEANVDDMNPQLVAPLSDALAAAGAVDVWSAPILMKKGRPALQISALAPPAAVADVERAFFRHSTTLGLRRRALERVVLARAFAKVATPYGPVRVKVAAFGDEVVGAQPEFEDCRRLAARRGVSAREVLAAAAAAARALLPGAVARRRS